MEPLLVDHREVFDGLETASAGSYDGTIVHRIIMGGIIQGGDPTTKHPQKAATYGKGGLGLLR